MSSIRNFFWIFEMQTLLDEWYIGENICSFGYFAIMNFLEFLSEKIYVFYVNKLNVYYG